MKKNSNKLPWRSVHFIGVGGVGMYGLAAILLDFDLQVSGSDAVSSSNTERLRSKGGRIEIGHRVENLAEPDVVVYSSAVPDDNPELQQARRTGLPCYRRGEFLTFVAGLFQTVIAVAGSHGKTTTTAMLVHILKEVGLAPGYLIGGDIGGWSTPASAGRGCRLLITEVDESDGTQALLDSDCAVIVNIQDDHCWSVGGEEALAECFRRFASRSGKIVAWKTETTEKLLEDFTNVHFPGEELLFSLGETGLVGLHNRINASLAIAAAEYLGVDRGAARAALDRFPGVERRMSVRSETPDGLSLVIEDYAHHPTELEAVLDTVREQWPDHFLTVIFQPHRFERVKRYAADFRKLLRRPDAVVVFRPFSAWVADEQIADPVSLVEDMEERPSRYWDGDFKGLADLAVDLSERPISDSRGPCLYLVVGAGDVCSLVPQLRERLTKEYVRRLSVDLGESLPELELEQSASWRDLTTLRIGGSCPLLARPKTIAELRELLFWMFERNLPWRILGCGSNLAGSDWMDDRLWISLRQGEFTEVDVQGRVIKGGAGVIMSVLVKSLLRTGSLDSRFPVLGWIPGSLGGIARMNAGCESVTAGEYIKSLLVVSESGELKSINVEDLHWGYRGVDLPDDLTICQVEFEIPQGDLCSPEEADEIWRKAGERRCSRQPEGASAGCVFRNPGEISAGSLIDRCGLKGEAHGGCVVSEKHANFIIVKNKNAEEGDFLNLGKQIVCRVYERTGIRLRPEIEFVNSVSAHILEQAVAPLDLAVLAGGPSRERKISLRSGRAVVKALRQAGHKAELLELKEASLPFIRSEVDVVFPALHGSFGEDGELQRMLNERNIPYVGSGPEASRLMMDKAAAKERLNKAGIQTPKWQLLTDPGDLPAEQAVFPMIIKPETEGSSLGITRVEGPGEEWRKAVEKAFKYSGRVLAEEFITGTEATAGVIFGEPLPIIEIVPPNGRSFDFDAKYEYKQGVTEYTCPPRSLSESVQEIIQKLAMRIWRELEAEDMVRFDFIVDLDGTPWFLEANSIPGFTAASLLPKAARGAGIGFPELCARLAVVNLPGVKKSNS